MANSAKNIDIFFEIGVLMWTLHPVHLPVLQRFACTYDGCVSESGVEVANLMHVVRNLHMPDINKRKELEEASWVIWSLYWEYLRNDPRQNYFQLALLFLERRCKNFGRCNWIERSLTLFAVFPDFLKLIPKRRKYHEQNE